MYTTAPKKAAKLFGQAEQHQGTATQEKAHGSDTSYPKHGGEKNDNSSYKSTQKAATYATASKQVPTISKPRSLQQNKFDTGMSCCIVDPMKSTNHITGVGSNGKSPSLENGENQNG